MVAVNGFPGTDRYAVDAVRDALASHRTPRSSGWTRAAVTSCLNTLIALVEHALERTAVAT